MTLKGKRCRRWADVANEEGLCWLHAYPEAHPQIRHSFFRKRPFFGELEQAYLAACAAGGRPLAAELFVMRLKMAYVLAYLESGVGAEGLTPEAWLAGYRVMLKAMRTISNLVQSQYEVGAAEMGEEG